MIHTGRTVQPAFLTLTDEDKDMSNLFSRIAHACYEDVTTEVLAYLLKEYPSCRSAFLSLVDASVNVGDYEVETQYVIDKGRPDLVLHDNKGQAIVLVENKPWDDSFFTYGDQLERYAQYLTASKFQKKKLCLLATDQNKDALTKAAGNVDYVLLTWEEVFAQLKTACSGTEYAVASFLLNELQAWMFPPAIVISPEVLQAEERIWENWVDVTTIVRQARNMAANDASLSDYRFMPSPGSNPKPDAESRNFFGYYIYDKKSGLAYWFGANIDARRFLKGQSLFVLQVRKGWENASGGKSDIDFDILKGCGFAYHEPSRSEPWACEYVYPLTGSANGNTANPAELAKALAEILKTTSEALP